MNIGVTDKVGIVVCCKCFRRTRKFVCPGCGHHTCGSCKPAARQRKPSGITKRELHLLRAVLDKVPDGPWYEVDGDVRTAPNQKAEDIVSAYPNEGGGAASLEIAQYIALLNPKFARKLLEALD